MDWIKEKIVAFFVGGYFSSLIRGGLKVAAGYLVAKGVVDQASADAWVAMNEPVLQGAIVFLVSQLWSFIVQKQSNAKY